MRPSGSGTKRLARSPCIRTAEACACSISALRRLGLDKLVVGFVTARPTVQKVAGGGFEPPTFGVMRPVRSVQLDFTDSSRSCDLPLQQGKWDDAHPTRKTSGDIKI